MSKNQSYLHSHTTTREKYHPQGIISADTLPDTEGQNWLIVLADTLYLSISCIETRRRIEKIFLKVEPEQIKKSPKRIFENGNSCRAPIHRMSYLKSTNSLSDQNQALSKGNMKVGIHQNVFEVAFQKCQAIMKEGT